MAGFDGYFGPQLTDEDIEEFRMSPYARKVQRPNTIDLNRIPVNPKYNVIPSPTIGEEDDTLQRYVGIGVGLATLITENLLSHPFLVLRRQCQVNHGSKKFHLVPVTLIPVIIHLHRRQGITTLWKGIGSVLVVRGMTMAIEDLLSKMLSLPKEVSWNQDSFKTISQHILLKCVTLVIITPFYSASLVETVQSDIASEKPGVFDVFREGIYRLVSFGSPQIGRMLPVWILVTPTVLHGLCKYFASSIVKHVASNIMQINYRHHFERKGAFPKDYLNSNVLQEIEVSAQLIALVASESVFYPLETILHRLHLQGTRTIIDHLDNGFAVTPILTKYEGIADCFDTTVAQEGSLGLFKGFGALVVQFTVHYAVLKLTKFLLTQVTVLLKSTAPPPPPPQYPMPVRQTGLPQTPLPVTTPSR